MFKLKKGVRVLYKITMTSQSDEEYVFYTSYLLPNIDWANYIYDRWHKGVVEDRFTKKYIPFHEIKDIEFTPLSVVKYKYWRASRIFATDSLPIYIIDKYAKEVNTLNKFKVKCSDCKNLKVDNDNYRYCDFMDYCFFVEKDKEKDIAYRPYWESNI